MTQGVTVVVPVYNREKLIVKCLDSILAQTLLPRRLIVVDNGSTDGTFKVVEAWIKDHGRDFRSGLEVTLLTEKKPGASAARNRGLQEVTTEYVSFFDSDDVMHAGLVKAAMTAVSANNPHPDIVCWKAEVRHLDGYREVKPFHSDNLVQRQFYNAILSTQCYMARTSLVRDAGAWDEEALVWNDWEIGIRLVMSSPEVVYIPEILATIYAQRQSITGCGFSEKHGDWEHTLDIVERKIEASDRPDKRRLLDMVDYRRAILAAHYRREKSYGFSAGLLARAAGRKGRKMHARLWLRLLYHYTVSGGRGAYYLWRR